MLAVAVLVGSAAVSGTVSYGGTTTEARAEVPHFAASPSRDAGLPGNPAASTLPTSPVDDGEGTPISSVSTPAAPRTMSMDEPIQGGLTAHQEQAVSAKLIKAHKDAKLAPKSEYWSSAVGRTAVARAESWLGMPYSWAGGNTTGPSAGRCEAGTGGDLDCHVVGFDCSGLTMYAWGPYVTMPHLADTQRQAGGFHPTLKQLLPGDLVFFSGYISGGVGHVGIYAGDGIVIEAPQSGSVVRRTKLKDMLANDGVYRGAVRPQTGRTPTLTAPKTSVRTSGGLVALRGTDLAQVTSVRFGEEKITDFVKHTDTAIVFRAPKHDEGTLALTVVTRWYAVSRPVALTYEKSKPKPVATSTAPTTPPATTAPPKSPPTKSPSPTKPAPPTTSASTTPPAKGSSTPTAPTPTPSPTGSSDTTAPAGP